MQSSSSQKSWESTLDAIAGILSISHWHITVMDDPCMWLQCEWHNQVLPVHAETQSNPTHKQTLTWVWYKFFSSYLKS